MFSKRGSLVCQFIYGAPHPVKYNPNSPIQSLREWVIFKQNRLYPLFFNQSTEFPATSAPSSGSNMDVYSL